MKLFPYLRQERVYQNLQVEICDVIADFIYCFLYSFEGDSGELFNGKF